MVQKGTGTRSSPISVDDSEDEVLQELCNRNSNFSPNHHSLLKSTYEWTGKSTTSMQASSSNKIPAMSSPNTDHSETRFSPPKRKRLNSVSSPSLETRLSKPESKTAKKRRRKLDRKAAEVEISQAHGRSLDFMAPSLASPEIQSPMDVEHFSNQYTISHQLQDAPTLPHLTLQAPFTLDYTQGLHGLPYDDVDFFDNPDQSISSSWVSSMVMAAQQPSHEVQTHVPVRKSAKLTLPPRPLIPYPPIPTVPPARPHHSTDAKPRESHGLPSKPPPQIIGVKPDPDPNSKHGVFALQKQGLNHLKKCSIPNPARTLVMEQLPKSQRSVEWVTSWCKSACGANPLNVSLDTQAGKALIEFATAELARKAWGSPKLGAAYAGLKTHQLKGKPREDLIKVWWYRVDGVGAGAGVGEIEEGEIEGDLMEEVHETPKKETKKERKARLAREREIKRLKYGNSPKERQAQLQESTAHQVASPKNASTSISIYPPSQYHNSTTTPRSDITSFTHLVYPLPHRPRQATTNLFLDKGSDFETKENAFSGPSFPPKAAIDYDGDGSIASSSRRSMSPSLHSMSIMSSDPKISSFIESREPMNVDTAQQPPVSVPSIPNIHPVPKSHVTSQSQSDLPNRRVPSPTSALMQTTKTGAVTSSQHLSAMPQTMNADVNRLASQELPPLVIRRDTPTDDISLNQSESRFPPLNSSTPFEPRAMMNVPTGPTFTKRALLEKQKELEKRIVRSKLELEKKLKSDVLSSQNNPTSTGAPSLPAASVLEDTEKREKQAMEDKLRTMVLQSKKSKSNSTYPNKNSDNSAIEEAIGMSSVPQNKSSLVPASSVSTHSFSLDELAVSFITQTIQTLQPNTATSAVSKPSVVSAPTNALASNKQDLALKQQQLERQIAESKVLMAKLTQARTKQERNDILALLREINRLSEDAPSSTFDHPSIMINHTVAPNQPKLTYPPRWPESQENAGMLIISDDEDDD